MARSKFFVPALPRLGRCARPPRRLVFWLLDIEARARRMNVTDSEVIAFAKTRARQGGKRRECFAVIDGNARQFEKPLHLRRYLRARGWSGGDDLDFLFHKPMFPDWRGTVTVFAPAWANC